MLKIVNKLEIDIEKIVFGGESLGYHEGFAVFVPMGVPGDRVEIEIISLNTDETQNKYIFNHINPFYKINSNRHILQIKETEKQLFIVQKVNVEDRIWDKLNNKRINLHTYLKG